MALSPRARSGPTGRHRHEPQSGDLPMSSGRDSRRAGKCRWKGSLRRRPARVSSRVDTGPARRCRAPPARGGCGRDASGRRTTGRARPWCGPTHDAGCARPIRVRYGGGFHLPVSIKQLHLQCRNAGEAAPFEVWLVAGSWQDAFWLSVTALLEEFGGKLRRCQECQAVYLRTGRQSYCRDQCARRARNRRHTPKAGRRKK